MMSLADNAVCNFNQWRRSGGKEAAVRYAAVRQKRILAGARYSKATAATLGPVPTLVKSGLFTSRHFAFPYHLGPIQEAQVSDGE